ncbi:MAG: hypothetical protein IPQ07_00875 [Myxococcales bacterium]|nr:hypothetical protein [Myxococcales bacterium]
MSAGHDEVVEEAPGPKVISVADRHPHSRTIQVVRPAPEDVSFLAATAKGLGITLKHFARNLFLPLKKLADRNSRARPPTANGGGTRSRPCSTPRRRWCTPSGSAASTG